MTKLAAAFFTLTILSFMLRRQTQAQKTLPIISLRKDSSKDFQRIVDGIGKACRETGFFVVKDHGVPYDLLRRLEAASHTFFALPTEKKREIEMLQGGKAWRGYFSVSEEYTSGVPDEKEGIYFGRELPNSDPRPLHGANLWPSEPEELRVVIQEYMQHMERLGQEILQYIIESIGISHAEFLTNLKDPFISFQVFNYPAHDPNLVGLLGVGEHTDYGYITILHQDNSGGLQIKSNNGTWIDFPPVDGTFVVNIGDALEHSTGGLLRATPHRVGQRTGATEGRLSFPFFFDPNFDAPMQSLFHMLSPELQQKASANRADADYAAKMRWDKFDPAAFTGNYGRYLMMKVSKVFPDLATNYLMTHT